MKDRIVDLFISAIDPKGTALERLVDKYRTKASETVAQGMGVAAFVERNAKFWDDFECHNHYRFENFRKGELIWVADVDNLVVNETLDDILNTYWAIGTLKTNWHILLTDGTPTVAPTDTMAAHPGWTEVTNYSEGTRQLLQLGTAASQSIDNSANKGVFSINQNGTVIGGGGLTDDNTKGGATGQLGGAGAFGAGDKNADNGDTLNVTSTLTASSS